MVEDLGDLGDLPLPSVRSLCSGCDAERDHGPLHGGSALI